MHALLVRLYRALQPVIGQPLRPAVHALRRWVLRDTSELGEATAVRALVRPEWPRWVVEVGANDGRTKANAFPFVRRGWDALLVEPNPRLFTRLEATMRAYPRARCVQAACSDAPGTLRLRLFEGDTAGLLSTLHPAADASRDGTTVVASEVPVRVERLTDLLDAHGVPADFAFLSVDTEGHDLHVLRGLDFDRYRPRLVLTETDAETEAEKRALLQAHGYRLATEVGVNTLWQRPE